MELKQHRPPVDIEEIEGGSKSGKKELHKKEKGKLTYASPAGGGKLSLDRGSRGPGKLGGSSNFILVGLAVLISLVLCVFIFSTKGDARVLVSNQKYLDTRIDVVEGNISTGNTRIDNIIANYATIASLGNYATTGSLSGYATKSQLEEAISNMEDSSYVYLTGSSGNYTLYVDSRPGTYTARISLIYTVPYSLNATTLEDSYKEFSGNWTGQAFVPGFGLNGTTYEVVSSSYYLGAFNITEGGWNGPIGVFSAPGTYDIGAEIMSIK